MAFQIPQSPYAATSPDVESTEPTQKCRMCCRTKKLSEMPGEITWKCEHKVAACKTCVENWLRINVWAHAWWKAAECPECFVKMEPEDVQRHATADTWTQYQRYHPVASRPARSHYAGTLRRRIDDGEEDAEGPTVCVRPPRGRKAGTVLDLFLGGTGPGVYGGGIAGGEDVPYTFFTSVEAGVPGPPTLPPQLTSDTAFPSLPPAPEIDLGTARPRLRGPVGPLRRGRNSSRQQSATAARDGT